MEKHARIQKQQVGEVARLRAVLHLGQIAFQVRGSSWLKTIVRPE